MVKCEICGKEFKTYKAYIAHLKDDGQWPKKNRSKRNY